MSDTARTVLHLPVTFEVPAGTTAAKYAEFMASEAALEIEKFSDLGGVTAGTPRIDPPSVNGQPTDTHELVEQATTALMTALALHENARGTVRDTLLDLWDTAADAANSGQVAS